MAGSGLVLGGPDPRTGSRRRAGEAGEQGPRTGRRCTHPRAAAPGSCRPQGRSGAEGTRAEIRDASLHAFLLQHPGVQGPALSSGTQNNQSRLLLHPWVAPPSCPHLTTRSIPTQGPVTALQGQAVGVWLPPGVVVPGRAMGSLSDPVPSMSQTRRSP